MNITLAHRRRAVPSSFPRCWPLACALALVLAGQARADVVTDWNAVVTGPLVAPRFGGPQQQARAVAMVQIAVHDALNSIHRRYETYDVVPTANASANPDAAVAAASRRVVLSMLASLPDSPEKTAAFAAVQDAFRATLGPLPYSNNKLLGIAAGQAAASAILARRRDDGSATPNTPYLLLPAPGVYQPTPNPEFPDVIVPAFGLWGQVTPFAVRDAEQFQPGPAEILKLGVAYAREYNEVKRVGDALVRGVQPGSSRSDIARFWPGGGSNTNLTARTLASRRHLDRWQHAQLFALLNIAAADGFITTMGAKYTYNFWRPVTAIRWAHDGNPDTVPDADWRPFLTTPPYPDYPCALPTLVGASMGVLRDYFGTDAIAFDQTFDAPIVGLPAPLAPLPVKTITRHFDSLSAATHEAIDARVYAGIHFRSGCIAGAQTGTRVAHFVTAHYLKPVL
jgi:hypothetical protein